MSKKKPLVVVTRKLPAVVETRMRELFDARLNVDDTPMSPAALVEAVKTADVLVPTVTDRIDAGMAVETPVLHRDHRAGHRLGNARIGQPFAIARPQRGEHAAVAGLDLDRLAVGRAHHRVEIGQGRIGHRHRDHQRQCACQPEDDAGLDQKSEKASDAAGKGRFAGWGAGHEVGK